MQKAFMTALAFLSMANSAASSAAEEITELHPSSKWTMEWTQTTCSLRRTFGEGSQKIFLQFERYVPSPGFILVVAGQPINNVVPGTRMSIQYGDRDPYEFHSPPLRAKGEMDGAAISAIHFSSSLIPSNSRKELAQKDRASIEAAIQKLENSTTSMALRWRGRTIRLLTDELGGPFAAMRTCTDDLISSWGLDPKTQASLSRPPTPKSKPDSWLRDSDYPRSLLQTGGQGFSVVRLLVDAQGAPSKCTMLQSFSDKALDDLACKLIMSRAEFEPALSSGGAPVSSYFIGQIAWIIRD